MQLVQLTVRVQLGRMLSAEACWNQAMNPLSLLLHASPILYGILFMIYVAHKAPGAVNPCQSPTKINSLMILLKWEETKIEARSYFCSLKSPSVIEIGFNFINPGDLIWSLSVLYDS